MGKNIIICLDGTGNQPGKNNSNVARLFRMLERKPGEQIAYYDPGVGTMGDPTYKTWIARKTNKVLGWPSAAASPRTSSRRTPT